MSSSTSGFQPHILVIDDNEDFAENLAEIIEDFGFSAEVVTSGASAHRWMLDRKPQLALIDINLPDVDGLDLLSTVRDRFPDCVCIIVTGDATLENAIESLNRGAFSYLLKTANIEEYRSAIQNALRAIKSDSEIRHLRETQQAIIENFPGRVLVLDGDGRLLHTNAFPVAVESFFLVDLARGGGVSAPDFAAGLAGWKREVAERFRQLIRRGRRSVLPELEVVLPDGDRRSYTIHFIPLSHDVIRNLIYILDVTGTVRLREEIKKSEHLAAVGELAMTIAHEIRNPLTGISGAVQVLQRKLGAGNPDREICGEVLGLIDRLNRTIEDLLLMARPTSIDRVSTRLSDVVDSYVKMLADDASFRSVRIETRCLTAADGFTGDPFRVRQALQNVVINAAHAMGGSGTIEIEIDRCGGDLTLAVRDDGPGFPEDTTKVLEPFYTTKPAGTGLGLSITRKILEAHGGRLLLRNWSGGAEAIFVLPAPLEGPPA